MAARPSEVVSCKEISKTQHIPRSFLYKILQRLLRAGLLRGWRGARGGFQLAVDPDQTTLLELVGKFERNFGLNRCVISGYKCELQPVCAVSDVWVQAWKKVVDTLGAVTLADLAANTKEKTRSRAS